MQVERAAAVAAAALCVVKMLHHTKLIY